MKDTINNGSPNLFGESTPASKVKKPKNGGKSSAEVLSEALPPNLGKAVRLPVPDFSDANRKVSCLEVDFPIAQINALSQIEGNAGKPIYQMSKWWARRRSSIFRSLLIAAATEAPDDPTEAAKMVWEHYYSNHQKAGSFKRLRVLDPFMGGGTTLVEGSRLGMQMTGIDLNPVAWFVVRNELACSDPERVEALFNHIESEVKPQIQPFYTTSCPRGHKGQWIDVATNQPMDVDPLSLAPKERKRFHWHGPEIVCTFWAKHGQCKVTGCSHRTPIFNSLNVAERTFTTTYIECRCPGCGHTFQAELGETRMAPGVERVVTADVPSFTELTQPFARLLVDFDRGDVEKTTERLNELTKRVRSEAGLQCPECGCYAGESLERILTLQSQQDIRLSKRTKKQFRILRKHVSAHLLIHPDWLRGASGLDDGAELGGWAGASAEDTAKWHAHRLVGCRLIEVRTIDGLPQVVTLADGTQLQTDDTTIPQPSFFACGQCGRPQHRLQSAKASGHSAPIAPYALQCYCPECDAEGYAYEGKYFRAPDPEDMNHLALAEYEWENRKHGDLAEYWPQNSIPFGMMTHVKNPLPDHGYSYWWSMFNTRQLLGHSLLLKTIAEAPEHTWPLDVREQALGAFQQHLRYNSMYSIYQKEYDKTIPHFSNANFNPKMLCSEIAPFAPIGAGRWSSCASLVLEGIRWARNDWDPWIPGEGRSKRVQTQEPIVPGANALCGSSTNLSLLRGVSYDLIVTDPPFGDNVYYADLADYFYAWLRIPLLQWYQGLAEFDYFVAERTPHSVEAIDNAAEHPEDRGPLEKDMRIPPKNLHLIREASRDAELQPNDLNPLYRPPTAADFYQRTLTACWTEAGRLLKPGGIMAFTFHHSEDEPWVDVLRALFDAGYLLVATYPIRSDETKGDTGAFGSKKIEYDIVHVCRKRLAEPEPVSWSRMRRWVREEAMRLKLLLEHVHGKELPESDLRVILRGKSLEFFSRHYGSVLKGDNQVLDVREALLGINQLLDDLQEESAGTVDSRPPDVAEPTSRLYLRTFRGREQMDRDELHKTLRGTGVSQGDLEALGWIRVNGKVVHIIPIRERFLWFTERGRNRKVLKSDLDQTHFLIGAAMAGSDTRIDDELANPNLRLKKAVDDILRWYANDVQLPETQTAARTALRLVEHWRARRDKPISVQQSLFEQLEEEEQ